MSRIETSAGAVRRHGFEVETVGDAAEASVVMKRVITLERPNRIHRLNVPDYKTIG